MDGNVEQQDKNRRFESVILPHLDAAYSLARWLARNDQDAEDVVQTAFVRAFGFFDNFRGGNARAWLLTIVRRVYYTWLRDHRRQDEDVGFDEVLHSDGEATENDAPFEAGSHPASIVAGRDARRVVNLALEKLPRVYREVVVLKEIENLSYKEIAEVVEIPIGTVMSRLARGRKLLAEALQRYGIGERHDM